MEATHARIKTHTCHCVLLLMFYAVCRVTCSCGEPDVIPNSINNSTGVGSYDENSVIKYVCNSGYRVSGAKYYTCVNGQWIYGSLTCIRIYCIDLDIPEHGRRTGTYTREVGTRASFACDIGYDMVGSSSMLCRADGHWRPAEPPSCDPKYCGEFGNVPNGNIWQTTANGIPNVYGNVIEVTCDDGYNLIGQSLITCSANGYWDHYPSCRQSSCPQHQGLSSTCIFDVSLSEDGSLLSILCEENSLNVSVTEVGPSTIVCENDQWDHPNSACYCDCMINTGHISASNLVNGFLKHGDNLQWTCDAAGTVKSTDDAIHCTDGALNQEPQCVTADTNTISQTSLHTNIFSEVTSSSGVVDVVADTNTISQVSSSSHSSSDINEPTGGTDSSSDTVVGDKTNNIKPSNSTSKANTNHQRSDGFKIQLTFFVYTMAMMLFVVCVY